MKSSLAFTLIALQILTLATVVYFQLESRRSSKTSIDRLEQVRDSLAGSVTRQSEIVLRLKGLVETLDQRADHAAAQAFIGGEHDAAARGAGGSPAPTPTAQLTADAHLRQLLQMFHDLQSARMNGTQTASMDQLFAATENDFVARGPQALVLLPEELRANRDEETRRYLLGDLLTRFATLDPKGCFQAARKILLDAAGSVGLRKLAAKQALDFDRSAALIDIRDLLGKANATSVELRVELLDVLKDRPDPDLEEALCRLAENTQVGPRIQTAAIRALGAYETPRTIESLKRIIDSGTPNAQTEALQAISRIMKKDAIPYLEEIAARDPKTVPDIVRGKAKNLAEELKAKQVGSSSG
jgi:hypothetical protein